MAPRSRPHGVPRRPARKQAELFSNLVPLFVFGIAILAAIIVPWFIRWAHR